MHLAVSKDTRGNAGSIKRPTLSMVKKVHRYIHATVLEMQSIFGDGHIVNNEFPKACQNDFDACDIWASSSKAKTKKKISICLVDEAFDQELQTDSTRAMINNEKFHDLNMVDVRSGYGKRAISDTHEAKLLKRLSKIH